MGEKTVGIKLSVGGEKEYTQSFSNAVKQTKLLQTETKSLAQEFEGSANSMEALQKKQENLVKLQEAFKQKLEAANTGLSNARKEYTKQADAVETLRKKLDQAEKSLKEMKDSGQEGTDAYEDQQKAIEELNSALQKQTQNMLTAEGRVTDWNKKVIASEADIRKNSRAIEENNHYLDEAKSSADGCATSIDKFGKEAKETGQDLEAAGKKSSTFADVLKANLTGEAIVSGLQAIGDKAKEAAEFVVEVGSSFEAGISEVEAISGATGSELEKLKNKAKELGNSTKFSATEAASAMTNMSLAGWSVNQTLSGIDGVLQLAAASGMGLADASQVVTDNISAFNLEASESMHIADMMAYAQANSSTTAAELGEAYKNCGANMNAANQDIEITTSMLEALANNGLRGSEAGTSLTAIMRDLTSKMKDGKIAIGDTSVAVMDSNGNFRNMMDILKDVEDATDGMGDAQKQAALMSTFTSDSIKGLNMLLSTGSDQVAGYEKNLRNCAGAASDMAATMQNNLQGKLTELSSATEGLGIAAYEYISGPLQGGVELLTDIISGLTDVITPQKDAMEDMYDEVVQSSKEIADNVQAIDDQFTGTLDSVENVGNLAARLEELNSVENRTAVQKQEMAAIVDKLSQSIPELAGAYDSENDKLSITNTELKDLVKNYQDVAVQQALVKATQDLVNESLEAQKIKDQAEEQKEIVEKRLDLLEQELELNNRIQNERSQGNWDTDYKTEALKLYEQALKDGTITLEEYQQAEKAIDNGQLENRFAVLTGQVSQSGEATGILATSVEELADQEDELNGVIDTQNQTLEKNEKTKEEYTKSAENLTKATEDGTDSTEDNTEAQKENADALSTVGVAAAGTGSAIEGLNKNLEASRESADIAKDAMRQILEEYNSTMESIKADLQNKISFADKFDGGDDLTTEQMNENLQSWVDGLQNYQQNLQRVREMTDESGKAIFSPAFIQAIEDQGTDAANMLQHMVWTMDNQGEYGVEQLKGIAKKWTDAMDISDETATVMAANKTAYELAMGELGSSDLDFSDLREAIDTAVSSAAEGWAELPEVTREAVLQTVQTAQECGIQIPEGLADGITSGEISPQQAMDQLNGTITGTIQGLAQVAKESGLQIPEEIQAGIDAGGQQAVVAMQELLQLIQKQASDAQAAGEDVGTAVGEGTQSSIKNQQSGVEKAGGELASSGAKAAESKKGEYQKAGSSAALQYQLGITSGKSGAISAAGAMASQASSAVKAYQNSFWTAGYYSAAGVASGISAGRSLAVSAATNMIRSAIAAAKAAANIHSPSKRFEKEVGYQIPAGTAVGINKNAKVAIAASGKMSKDILKNATDWLSKYNANHEISLDNEKWYWEQVAANVKKGSAAYKNAMSELDKLKSSKTVTNALRTDITGNFGVSRTKTVGSGDNQRIEEKDIQDYNSEILSAAEKQLSAYQTLHATSLAQERNYWQVVKGQLAAGTDAWYETTRKIQSLEAEIVEEKETKQAEALQTRANVQKSLLETYKTYYKMSAKAEMDYWNIARKQFKAGTEERIEADQKYLEAKEEYEKQKLELDEDYKEKKEKIEKELSENIQELEEKRNSAVADRKKDILSSMNNFDAWDASGYTQDALIYNMKTQVEGLKLWESQLQELSGKGLAEGLLEELKDAGPEAAANIYSLNQMTAEQLEEFNNLWQEKNDIAERQAKKDTQDTWDSVGQEIDQLKTNAKKELADLKSTYRANLKELREGLSTGLKDLVRQAGKIGEDVVGSLIAGIEKAGTAGVPISINVLPTGTAATATTKTQASVATTKAVQTAVDQEGYRTGAENIVENQLAWLFENNTQEYVLRKSDGAIMQNMLAGDKVINPQGAETLYQFAQDPDQFLRGRSSADQISTAGIEMLNRLIRTHSQAPSGSAVQSNADILSRMDSMMKELEEMTSGMVEAIQNMAVQIDSDAFVGAVRGKLNTENEMAAIRRTRGRIR